MVVGSYNKTEFNDPRAICLSVVLRWRGVCKLYG